MGCFKMEKNMGERWSEWDSGKEGLIGKRATMQEKGENNSINNLTCMHCHRKFAGPELSNGTLLCPVCDSSNLITEG